MLDVLTRPESAEQFPFNLLFLYKINLCLGSLCLHENQILLQFDELDSNARMGIIHVALYTDGNSQADNLKRRKLMEAQN